MTSNNQPSDPLQKEEVPEWFEKWIQDRADTEYRPDDVPIPTDLAYQLGLQAGAYYRGAIAAYRKLAEEVPGWISVSIEPEPLQSIMVTDGRTIHAGGYYIENGKFCLNDGTIFQGGSKCCDLEEHYTHWMPLPIPPNT